MAINPAMLGMPMPQASPFQNTQQAQSLMLQPTPSVPPVHPLIDDLGLDEHTASEYNQILPNKVNANTRYLPKEVRWPTIHPTATVRRSKVRGDVRIGAYTHIVNARLRADEGTPFHVGDYSNVQSNVVLHGHSTQLDGQPRLENLVFVPSKGYFSIYIGNKVSLAHGATVHGPAFIGDNSFVSFNATVDHANVGRDVEIGAHAYISNVTIPDGVGIAAGAIITKQEDVAKFIVPRKGTNDGVSQINTEMALTYFSPRFS